MKKIEPIIEQLDVSEEEFFNSRFWGTIPESYTQVQGKKLNENTL
jgi:hypothetical protein